MWSHRWILVFLCLLVAPPLSWPQNYTVTVIDLYDETEPMGINELGDHVGQVYGPNFSAPYLAQQGQDVVGVWLGDDPFNTQVFGVNNELKRVGVYKGQMGFYQDGETVQFLNHPKGALTYAFGLQNRGKTDTLIVGAYVDKKFVTETAYLLTRGKTWQSIPIKGAQWSRAYGASAKQGVMVSGWYYDQNWVSHGFLYKQASKQLITLDVPGSLETHGRGMNDHGHVVLSYYDAAGALRGALWDGTTYHLIDVEGAFGVIPTDVNNSGTIVGMIFDGVEEFHLSRGFVATPGPASLASR